MEQRRTILILVFLFSLFMLWTQWQKELAPLVVPEAGAPSEPTAAVTDVPVPEASLRRDGVATGTVPGQGENAATKKVPRLRVLTDMVEAQISAQGGSIVRLSLRKQKVKRGSEDNLLLFDDGEHHIYEATTGLIGTGLPTHLTQFALPAEELVMADGADSLTVRLVAPAENGLQVAKLLTFHRGSYLIDVAYEIVNGSEDTLEADAYFQLSRDGEPAEAVQAFGVRTFTGPAFYSSEGKFQKVSFTDIEENKAKFVKRASDGWMAIIQHYFVSAWLPEEGGEREFFVRKNAANLYSAGFILPVDAIAPGQSGRISARLFAGPQEQDKLADVAKGLDLVVDYGWLTVIAAPLFWVLSWFHSLTGNWGWAIILVTICIKLVFFPLSAASYKSMARMRVLAPRMQRLKEVYGNDKPRLQQEMMAMYRKEKINPLGGCLPIVIQIPVFIALYWALLGSVEMRHAPWLGWIQDLSSKDPFFILPIIMGASMLVQMKLNPAPPDPIQAKVMMMLPLVFTVLFAWFPSGLVLYWVVNNLLSIAQQWQITRMIESGKEGATKKAG